MRFQVLTAASVKMAAFWDIAPYNPVELDRHFRGACCLHHQGTPIMEAVLTSVYLNETTRRYVLEGCHFQQVFFLSLEIWSRPFQLSYSKNLLPKTIFKNTVRKCDIWCLYF
jgi:hypothetical protein